MGIVYILWTGGFDSTFRLLQLSRKKQVVQPIYVLDQNRQSTPVELKRMNDIILSLTRRSDTYAEFKDILLVKIESIPKDDKITQAFESIQSKIKIGGQYEWLARLAKQYPNIELGIEKPNGDFGGCTSAIAKFGHLVEKDGTFVLDKENSTEELVLLFGNFTFPISNITEIDMVKWIKDHGYEEEISKIWFCHHPIHNAPCGICGPCLHKMGCGMEFLLPEKAHTRYHLYKKLDKRNKYLARIYSHIVYYINKSSNYNN